VPQRGTSQEDVNVTAPCEERRSGVERRGNDLGYVARLTGEPCNLRLYAVADGFPGSAPFDRRKSSPSSVEEGDSRNESGPTSAGGGDPLAEVCDALERAADMANDMESYGSEDAMRAALATLRRARVVACGIENGDGSVEPLFYDAATATRWASRYARGTWRVVPLYQHSPPTGARRTEGQR